MAQEDGDCGESNSRSGTNLFSESEIEALGHEFTAVTDITGAIRALAHSCAAIEPEWKRKTVIIEKLQNENRRVLQCRAILQAADQRWRELRARTKLEREARRVGTTQSG